MTDLLDPLDGDGRAYEPLPTEEVSDAVDFWALFGLAVVIVASVLLLKLVGVL